ncbi:unnamed protein product [Dovyalis caffra]|uniref:Uncharacterized protein n=1 Tax=Dovyalis caffra TaxID=77055 RepID=A0AAV1RXE0_9ROSI|nr:unnamed protein product [Dovyalis caffra]
MSPRRPLVHLSLARYRCNLNVVGKVFRLEYDDYSLNKDSDLSKKETGSYVEVANHEYVDEAKTTLEEHSDGKDISPSEYIIQDEDVDQTATHVDRSVDDRLDEESVDSVLDTKPSKVMSNS